MVFLFDVPAYFILLRETLECVIILSVLLSLIDKLIPVTGPGASEENSALRKQLKKQVWLGTAVGLGLSLVLGVIFIVVFYVAASNLWEASGALWEGIFSLLASVIITVMAFGMIRVQHWQDKWRLKLEQATRDQLDEVKSKKRLCALLPPRHRNPQGGYREHHLPCRDRL